MEPSLIRMSLEGSVGMSEGSSWAISLDRWWSGCAAQSAGASGSSGGL